MPGLKLGILQQRLADSLGDDWRVTPCAENRFLSFPHSLIIVYHQDANVTVSALARRACIGRLGHAIGPPPPWTPSSAGICSTNVAPRTTSRGRARMCPPIASIKN